MYYKVSTIEKGVVRNVAMHSRADVAKTQADQLSETMGFVCIVEYVETVYSTDTPHTIAHHDKLVATADDATKIAQAFASANFGVG